MRDWSGQQVGNYQVTCRLEQAAVIDRYRGYELDSQRQVTLYFLAVPTDDAGIFRFRRNLPICQRLVHPHLAPLLDSGTQDMTPFVVLDSLPTSRQYHHFPLPISTVVQHVEQLADAFDYIHSQGFWPIPTTPETILISNQGEALLAGFVPRLLEISRRVSEKGEVGWNATYLSPEQLAGAWPGDTFSDQYVFAVVVYEWLCGLPPFQGSSLLEIARQHLLVPPPSLQEKIPTIPQAVDQVVKRALTKKPEERFATVKAFSAALREAGEGGINL